MYTMAHRGASALYPENTMLSFEKAIEKKFDYIELDVRLSKDKIPVVIHDSTIQRTSSGGKRFVHELTVNQLKKYDYGNWFHQSYKGLEIPLLEEVFQLIQNENIQLNIELKNGPIIPESFEQIVLDLIYKYNLQDRIMFSSFDHQTLYRLYQLDSTVKLGLIFHINLVDMFSYLDNLDMKISAIHPNYFYITKEMIDQAHKRNLKVNAYTVNDEKLAQKLKLMGVDGLISDRINKV